ncbi:GroES-like protein [Xylariaceae sp. FL0594]|nr:GroES-like protein [Xylariaceae sp. FL0594]
MSSHLAAVLSAKGEDEALTVHRRPTPDPGPGELLIQVKSVALNPADWKIRDSGLFIPSSAYPTVIGFDIAGLVLKVGRDVPITCFRPGVTRVAAYAASVWRSFGPDYGAFQERCLVPWQHAVPLPIAPGNRLMSWNEAATLPVAAVTALNAWDVLSPNRSHYPTSPPLPRAIKKKKKGEALLIWGASSSIGTMGVQFAAAQAQAQAQARVQVQDPDVAVPAAVYATASKANHAYILSLGADCVFDHDPDAIVTAARRDGLVIRRCFLATGELAQCQRVLRAFAFEGEEEEEQEKAKIASAPPLPSSPDVSEEEEVVESIFVYPSTDEAERLRQFQYWLGTCLGRGLADGHVRPSPEPRVVGRGLHAINDGLKFLKKGVSCAKLVVEISD